MFMIKKNNNNVLYYRWGKLNIIYMKQIILVYMYTQAVQASVEMRQAV